MTDHQYPKGAIKSVEAFREILATVWGSRDDATVTVYYVHGLGSSSFTTKYVMNRHSEIRENHIGLFINERYTDTYSPSFSLADANIGHHYNHHYLFTDAADATAYLEHALVNTPEIRRDWDYDYDYDDHDYSREA